MSEARLKPGGIVLIVGFAAMIVGMAWWATQKKQANQQGQSPSTTTQPTGPAGGGTTTDPASPTTTDGGVPLAGGGKFEEVGRQTVPQVKGGGKYTWNAQDPTVVFPINIWAGWGPIIAANDGFAAGSPNSVFKKHGFKVEIRLIDDPVQTADAYASGQAHTMWGTLDMIALFAPQLKKVGLTPKVFQQVDWSRGGDGIVVRSTVRSLADLKGKSIALCQNSPSHFYILRMLEQANLRHTDVQFRFTSTAFGASALFAQDRGVHACVSWAPDIYTLVDPKHNVGNKNRLLSTTASDASNIIADVWAARPDFAQEHPEVIEGLVRGIFEGMNILAQKPDHVAALMAQGYGFPVEDCKSMLHDAYSTGLGDNEKFFLDQNSDVNFVNTWNKAVSAYRTYGAIEGAPVAADQVMDAKVITKLKEEGAFSEQQAEKRTFEAIDASKVRDVEASLPEVLRVPLNVTFKPNSWELDEKHDPSIPETLKKIKALSEEFGAARIVIEGNTDTSRKNEFRSMGARVYAEMTQAVQELSEKRAAALREAVLKLMPGTDPNKIVSFGNGWDNPVDPVDHAKNRRVDVRVLPVE